MHRNTDLDLSAWSRFPGDWEDAEDAAAAWMRRMGHHDARTTCRGADGGIDVRGKAAVAQMKAKAKKVTRPEVQQLHGAASGEPGRVEEYFFSTSGFTYFASKWADKAGIATFILLDHAVAPCSLAAKRETFRMEFVKSHKYALLGRVQRVLLRISMAASLMVSIGFAHASFAGPGPTGFAWAWFVYFTVMLGLSWRIGARIGLWRFPWAAGSGGRIIHHSRSGHQRVFDTHMRRKPSP